MAEVGMQQAIGRKQILVGEARYVPMVPKKEIDPSEKKYTQFLKEVFDVAEPVLYQEIGEQAAVQGELTLLTGAELAKKMKPWEAFETHKDWKRLVREVDFAWRGKDVPHRLGRVFMNGLIQGGSFAIDYVADSGVDRFLHDGKKEIKDPIFKKTLIELSDENRYVLRDGLEFAADKIVGYGANVAVKGLTHETDVRYPSQLANTISEMGNLATAIGGWNTAGGPLHRKIFSSMINPGFIEGSLRSMAAIPVFGAGVEKIYTALNDKLKNQDGGLYLSYLTVARMLYTKFGYLPVGTTKPASGTSSLSTSF
ncbi:MAG: hypothetical protein AAB492_03755 [Patescibacteria group bacterium]